MNKLNQVKLLINHTFKNNITTNNLMVLTKRVINQMRVSDKDKADLLNYVKTIMLSRRDERYMSATPTHTISTTLYPVHNTPTVDNLVDTTYMCITNRIADYCNNIKCNNNNELSVYV